MQSADEQFKQLLKSENDYEDLIGIFASHFSGENELRIVIIIQNFNRQEIKKLSKRIFKTISNVFLGKRNATRFYLSARLIKDLMLLDQSKFEDLCAMEILPSYSIILSQLAYTTIEEKIPEYFVDNAASEKDRLMAEKFFKVALESVQFWSKQEMNNIIFEQTYLELKQKQVPFPAQFQFYSQQDIEMQSRNQSLNGSKKSSGSNYQGFQQDELKEGQNKKQNQQNPLYKSIEKYEDFKNQIKEAVDSCRGNEKELKNLSQQVKQIQVVLEEDISKCINDQESDPNLQNVMNDLFDQSGWFNQFDQDIENFKQGIFDSKVFFQKYGSGNSHIQQNADQRQYGSHKDGTPTPQDDQHNYQQPNTQQNKQNQQKLMNFNEDDGEEEEYLRQFIQQEQQQQQMKAQQLQNSQQSQIKQSQMKLSETNQQKQEKKQESYSELQRNQLEQQYYQKQQSDQSNNQNEHFDQQLPKPKGAKDYFEEELYDPHRAAEQNNIKVQTVPKNSSTHQNSAAQQNPSSSIKQSANIGQSAKQSSQNQFNNEQDKDLQADQKIKQSQMQERSRMGNQNQPEELTFKSFTNESFQNKQYQSMIKSNSQSKFTKVMNQNAERYIQPYASSKIGYSSSISNMDRYDQKSQIYDKNKPMNNEKEKMKEMKQDNINLQSQIYQLQSNIKTLSSVDSNQLLIELKTQSDENKRRVDQQNEIIVQLQNSMQQIQDENQRLKSQGSQLYNSVNNSENEQLKSQIKKLQFDYEELLQQRNSNRSNDSKIENVEQHPQFQSLMRKNEELKSKINQQNVSNQESTVNKLINPQSDLQNSTHGGQSSRGKVDGFQPGQLSQIAPKRHKSPKIFQDFKPRGVDEQTLRQSVDSLNIQGTQNQNNKQFFSSSVNQQVATQHSYNGSLANNHADQLNQFRSTTNRVGGNVFPTVNQSGLNNIKTQYKPIFNNSQSQNNNTIKKAFESPQSKNLSSRQGDILGQIGNDSQSNKPGSIKREFNTPPQYIPGQRLLSNGQNTNSSPKRIFDGMGDMKDVSQIPSIIFNEKREEIESIQKNNQSNNSYSESVKEILNPLSTKNNLKESNQLNAAKNTNNGRPLNFSEVKEGEQVLITQYVSKLNRFKASCLKSKYPIYEDSQIQIGVVSSHQQSNVHISPEVIQEIEPKQQKKQEVMIAYSFMPFNPCFVSINYSGVSPLYLGIPNTVNKMFQFKDINKDLFKRQFKERKYIKYILIPDCNPKFAKTHQDFKMYLDKLIDLNPESEFDHIQGTSKFKMGLQFTLDQFSNERNPQDFLMKIVCNPDHSAHVFIAFNDYNQNEKVHFILNTFCFLFSSNKDD